MSQVSGVVQSIESRKVMNGTKTAYNIVVGGQSYGAGLFKPKVNEGDYVTFVAESNGNFLNVERGTLKTGKAPAGEAKQAVATAVKQAVGGYDARQDAISRQAASNTAIAWVTLLHNAGALPTGAKSKGSQQEALDIIRAQYEKLFYEGNTGNEWKDIRPNVKAVDEEHDDSDSDPADEEWT